MDNNKVTMQQIADKLGISKVSVSKAINNQEGISQELRKKILSVAVEMGYMPKKKFTTADKQDYKLAFFTPKRYFFENENFYSQIFYYLNKECSDAHYTLSVFIINAEDEHAGILPSIYLNDDFDGVFVGGEMESSYIQNLLRFQKPVILIDFYKPGLDLDCILVDNFYIGYEATTYLIQNGHTRIGFVGNIEQASSIADRFYGYQKALAENQLTYSKEWNIVNNEPLTGLYTENISLPGEMPTAFLCYCDMAAFYLIKTLSSRNLHVPQDISIISFDNTEISKSSIPPLTTVDISKKQLANHAFQQMLLRLDNPDSNTQRVIVSTKLVIRSSVRHISCDG
ncbi:LacI family DNA-binding transcriptional regulator [Diplocloster hominis]|uniref:LacI family DNA-binding transcriptional regulator n=1 Tax=Diplocloster hominis TaxID=3079010 RepID=UPI0031BB2BEA